VKRLSFGFLALRRQVQVLELQINRVRCAPAGRTVLAAYALSESGASGSRHHEVVAPITPSMLRRVA
jgi:hypothetical protein